MLLLLLLAEESSIAEHNAYRDPVKTVILKRCIEVSKLA